MGNTINRLERELGIDEFYVNQWADGFDFEGCGRMGGDNVGEDFQREFERLEADLMPEPRPDGQKRP